MTIEEYFGDWQKVIDLKEAKRVVNLLARQEKAVCPEIKDIFKAFRLCSLDSLRVVICGQDPYADMRNGKPVATGIAFANSRDTSIGQYSPSLYILRESVIDFTVPRSVVNFDQSLEKWEGQGVLMLNSALSCFSRESGSHILLWRPFMTSLFSNLSRHCTGIVYVLMGSQAQTLEPYIDKRFNDVIKTRHPSYYARTGMRMPSSPWREINDILVKKNGYGIEWFTSLTDKKEENEEVFYEGD